jgi:hypothetical protein
MKLNRYSNSWLPKELNKIKKHCMENKDFEQLYEDIYQELNRGNYGLTASAAHKLTLWLRKRLKEQEDVNNKVMGIVEALKNENIRISYGHRWLYFDQSSYEWVVIERPYGKKKNIELFRGLSIEEEKAVNILLAE